MTKEADHCLQILKVAFDKTLKKKGIRDDDLSELLIDDIVDAMGGEQIYIPRRTQRSKAALHAEIVRKFNGGNAVQLARAYGYSVRHIRRLISADR